MNPELSLLQPYPFQRLAELKDGVLPPENKAHISLSIGEPKHAPPAFVLDAISANLDRLSSYPATLGIPELRGAIAQWLQQRFKLGTDFIDPDRHVLPVNGTREALFAFAQAVVDRQKPNPLVVSPNPFYQIYEGAALLSGATPWFLNCLEEDGYIPDFKAVPADVWQRCQLLYICSPGNPTGAVMSIDVLKRLIELADEHDFIIASDECYSELYDDDTSPPPGLLQACAELKRNDMARCVVFHSLSKRSNLPGLRSGFVAGDATVLKKFLLYRTYHGCAMSVTNQIASVAAWQDEEHVKANRQLYRDKFTQVLNILNPYLALSRPAAGFYLWPTLPVSDEIFTRALFAQQNITVLPGRYLARNAGGTNPGEQRVRLALVASSDECTEAAHRIAEFLQHGNY